MSKRFLGIPLGIIIAIILNFIAIIGTLAFVVCAYGGK